MITVDAAIGHVLAARERSKKPLGVILAGHNGSGKSTMWRRHLSPALQIPLVNADRMMLSILPEPDNDGHLEPWARQLRDTNLSWMRVAQKGVEAFVAQAILNSVPFAMETVFSHWVERGDGTFASKIELIDQMRAGGYFTLLAFVGLANVSLSVGRVRGRVAEGGHSVPLDKLLERYPRTQKAISAATRVADASILVDNSLDASNAFTVSRVQLANDEIFDLRRGATPHIATIRAWLDVVSPLSTAG
jgi:predicted ABC-type ATPase